MSLLKKKKRLFTKYWTSNLLEAPESSKPIVFVQVLPWVWWMGNGSTLNIMRLRCPFNKTVEAVRLSAEIHLGWGRLHRGRSSKRKDHAAGTNWSEVRRPGWQTDLLNEDFIAKPFCLPAEVRDTTCLQCNLATLWHNKLSDKFLKSYRQQETFVF